MTIAAEATGPHRAWIEIDHGALRANLATLRERAGPGKQVIAVVKANAYGHGALEVARTLLAAGVERLAVATVGEAAGLRAAGISLPTLVLWAVGPLEAAQAVALDLEPIVYHASHLEILEHAAEAAGHPIGLHLKVDTGLGRQGTDPQAAIEIAARIARSRWLRLAGTCSHLAVPGEDDAYTDGQLASLARVLDQLRSLGIDPGLVHVSATGGVLAGAGLEHDAIRPGLGLYGLAPAWAGDVVHRLRPVLSLKARPLRIFDLPAGQAIGYGLRFRASAATRIATLGLGYGDGWPRAHANNGAALVRGHRVPMVGAISMDGLTVDVGQVDGVSLDDEFVLIGDQAGSTITADEVAAQRRTIHYEVVTALRERLPRHHLGAVS